MNLILQRDGIAVDLPSFASGVDFYYTAGKVGITAQDGWTFEQQILIEGEDGEPVVQSVVNWSVVGSPEPEPEPLTPEQARHLMPPLSKLKFRLGLVSGAELLPRPEGSPPINPLQMISDFIDAIEDEKDRQIARIYWEDTGEFERMHPRVVGLSAAIGFTPEQTDALWIAAAGMDV